MNALSRVERGERWNPFKDMEDLQNKVFSSLFGRLPLRRDGGQEETMSVTEWAPLVDITEDEKEYLIKAELPEIRKDDLHVTVENGVLTINGERKFEKVEKGKRYHRVERAYGTFTRSFTLPEDADGQRVNAEFKDGILRVHVAKDETAKPKAIDVKVS